MCVALLCAIVLDVTLFSSIRGFLFLVSSAKQILGISRFGTMLHNVGCGGALSARLGNLGIRDLGGSVKQLSWLWLVSLGFFMCQIYCSEIEHFSVLHTERMLSDHQRILVGEGQQH